MLSPNQCPYCGNCATEATSSQYGCARWHCHDCNLAYLVWYDAGGNVTEICDCNDETIKPKE